MRKHHAVILVAVALVAVAPALAAGFGFYEQSAKASAQGGAWVARADDAAANWYNPAALVHLSGREVQFGTNWLDVGGNTTFTYTPQTSATTVTIDAVGNNTFPSYFYYAQKINDRLAWGIGVNNPFGLISEWDTVPMTYSSQKANFSTFNFNPNLAFKISESWSAAIGFDYLAVQLDEFSRVVPPTSSPTVNFKGEGNGLGYNLALQFKIKSFSIAGQYRSAMTPTIRGNLTFSGAASVFNASASAGLAIPSMTMLGAAWTSDRVDVEVDATYTAWNTFKSLTLETSSPLAPAPLTENWASTWSYRLGVAVRLDKDMHHELRFGGLIDDSPVQVEYLRPSIPDSDRTGYTLGYGWQGKQFGVDLYAMQLEFDDVTAMGVPPYVHPVYPINADGVIDGTYKSSVLLVGGTFKYRF